MIHGIKDIFVVISQDEFCTIISWKQVTSGMCMSVRPRGSGLESSNRVKVGKPRRSFQISCLGPPRLPSATHTHTPRAALVAGHMAIVGVIGIHLTAWLSIKLCSDQFGVYYSCLQTLFKFWGSIPSYVYCVNINYILSWNKLKYGRRNFLVISCLYSVKMEGLWRVKNTQFGNHKKNDSRSTIIFKIIIKKIFKTAFFHLGLALGQRVKEEIYLTFLNYPSM